MLTGVYERAVSGDVTAIDRVLAIGMQPNTFEISAPLSGSKQPRRITDYG